MLIIGVLDLQGAVSEHIDITKKALNTLNIKGKVINVRSSEEASNCDGIIIAGGESTVIGKLIYQTGIKDVILDNSIPIFGTCAGMILLSKKTDYDQPLLNIIDMEVSRNSFGRQRESFEKEVTIFDKKYPGVFIRAPSVKNVEDNVKILSKLDETIIAVKQGKNMALSFHPELTDNTFLHERFILDLLEK